MLNDILMMIGLTIIQNASFTLVSRARNSNSITYNALASVISNGIWLLVISKVVTNLDNIPMMIAYIVGAVIGSVGMQLFAIKVLEKDKVIKKSINKL